jgi:hypothetical protein
VHPTIDEQLDGIARLVEQAAGRVDDVPTAERLRTAAGTLRRIGGSWWAVLPYLTWDNDSTLALLELLGGGSDRHPGDPDRGGAARGGIAARTHEATAAPLDPLDVKAVHARNLELRALLAEAIRALPPAEVGGGAARAARAAVAAHVRERIARDPSGGLPRRSP